MSLNKHDISKLRRIIALAGTLITKSQTASTTKSKKKTRLRRSGKELVQFRKMLKAERKKGVSVAALARKHKISLAYIYTLP